MSLRLAAFLLPLAPILAAGPAAADEPPTAAVESRLAAGVSAGLTHMGAAAGRSLELAVEVAIGPAAALRLEAGEMRFDDLGRRDRRASAGVVMDLTSAATLGFARLTPFAEGSFGFTGTQVFDQHDWRPHLQAGGGLRLDLGSRISISGRVQAGVQRAPDTPVLLEEEPTTSIAPPVTGAERERYTRWQLAGLLRF